MLRCDGREGLGEGGMQLAVLTSNGIMMGAINYNCKGSAFMVR